MILTLDAARRDPLFGVCEVESLDFGDLRDYVAVHGHATDRHDLDEAGWNLAPVEVQRLLDKLRTNAVPLGEYVGKEIYYGIKTGLNDAFVIDRATRDRLVVEDPASAEIIKPFLAGRDIKRYETPEAEKFLILFRKGWTRETSGYDDEARAWAWLREHYPAICRWLEPFEAKARKRYDKGEFWWELRACEYYDKFEEPKIFYPDISLLPSFMFDNEGFYAANTAYFISSGNLALLGILNSSVTEFFLRYESNSIRGGYIRYFTQSVSKIPLPPQIESSADTEAIARDVEAILQHSADLQRNRRRFADYCRHALQIQPLPRKLETPERLDFDTMLGELKKRKAPVTDPRVFAAVQDFHREMSETADAIALLERRIDRAVYRLYGLNEAEIKLIEEG